MNVVESSAFRRAVKKLHANQKKDLDAAVRAIMDDPSIGAIKHGDLAGIQVYKFKMVKQLTLLAYFFEAGVLTLTLLNVGSHENFYRDLKKSH